MKHCMHIIRVTLLGCVENIKTQLGIRNVIHEYKNIIEIKSKTESNAYKSTKFYIFER